MKSHTASAFALLAAAVLAGGLAPGCSLEVSPLEEAASLEEELPPLLEFETPYEGLVYTAADDEQPGGEGVELSVRVRVRDLEHGIWLEDLSLGDSAALEEVPVHADWRGFRCAELRLVVHPEDEGAEQGEQRFQLVAEAGSLGRIERELIVALP